MWLLVLQLWGGLLVSLMVSTAGVTHWKLQDGVIKSVGGPLVISADDSSAPAGEDHVIYDRELYMLMSQPRKSHQSDLHVFAINADDPPVHRSAPAHQPRKTQQKTKDHKAGSSTRPSSSTGAAAVGSSCNKKKVSNSRPDPSSSCNVKKDLSSQPLTCGEPVEFTAYDFLEGVARRNELVITADPEVAMVFRKTVDDQSVDLIEVETLLRRLMKESFNDPEVLNQVGNLWRVKGDAQLAIECFRRALSISPNNPDILLNVARLLLHLKFVDDAIFLAKLSLHHKRPRSDAWLQHYTLGEAFKALKDYENAIAYFRKALELDPTLHMAKIHLRELENHSVTNIYTAVIILSLVSTVLLITYYLFCIRNNLI